MKMLSEFCLILPVFIVAGGVGCGDRSSNDAGSVVAEAEHAHAVGSVEEGDHAGGVSETGHVHGAAEEGGMICGEHGVLEAECGICQPQAIATLEPGQGLKVRLPSLNSARGVGVEIANPESGAMSDTVECFAEIGYNQNRLAQIVAPVGGIVQRVNADLGETVEDGKSVAQLWSASIAEAVAQAVLTHQTLQRERVLGAEGVTSQRELQEAEAVHRAACQQLRTLGFSEEQIDEMGERPGEAVLLEVVAPFAGEIVERNAVRGSLVDAGHPLFVVADRSVMWARLDLPETVLVRVALGQSVELTLDALPGRSFSGNVTWIAPAVDDRTRMGQARVEIANPDGVLRDKMFARARLATREVGEVLSVPSAAVQRVNRQALVFVPLEPDLFEARAVRLGCQWDGRQEILAGLTREEPVVVAMGFALKSQLLLSRLGAGCADE